MCTVTACICVRAYICICVCVHIYAYNTLIKYYFIIKWQRLVDLILFLTFAMTKRD